MSHDSAHDTPAYVMIVPPLRIFIACGKKEVNYNHICGILLENSLSLYISSDFIV